MSTTAAAEGEDGPDFRHDGPGTPADLWRGDPRWDGVEPLRLLDREGRACTRVVVAAAHPDDESLGAAGLLATAHGLGLDVEVVLVTDGGGSHPGSPTVTRAGLAGRRREESRVALDVVAPGAAITYLGIEDGRAADHETEVTRELVAVLGDARGTLLVAPWRHDAHPDHEAVGRAAASAARRTGARLVETPIWFWHWGRPDDAPWADLRALELSPEAVELKARSVAAHVTQVGPLSEAEGDETLLLPDFLAHFAGSAERYVEQAPSDAALELLHAEHDDPWGVDTRWFEQRKRDLTAAVLPHARFRRGLELGCSTGALAAVLAARCDELVALDSSPTAVAAARRRLEGLPHVQVARADLPSGWPEGRFDLVVVSELGYFLSPVDLDTLIDRAAASLTPDGHVVLCHWRHEIEGWVLDAAAVRARFRERLGRPELAHYADVDVEISVLGAEGRWPLAQR